ncbi:MAG: hypothetical protein EAZ91_07250 [Cytophagales bacterium]|nr:MAG: hypothetical protein EAZ91_07250 [Cytophagales bacterium]
MRIFFLLPLLFFAIRVNAQSFAPVPPPAHLAPILHAPGSTILGPSYYYKGRRLSAPFSVEVPILELNDPVATMHFKRFRTWTNVGRLTGLASVAYVLFNRTPDPQTRRVVYIGSLIASVGFSLVSNSQVNKAVRRYNAVVDAPKIGVTLLNIPGYGQIPGVGVIVPI